MKPWVQVVVPDEDVRKGGFDESVFAADLSDVVADRAPTQYRDAETFFRKTYLTQGLLNLLSAVLARLSGKGRGEAVIQIQTPFGGGKTHSLIALYNLFTHGGRLGSNETVQRVMQEAEVRSIPKVRVAPFVGTSPDPLEGRTPWGELAARLQNYALLREHDQQRIAPGKDLLHELIGATPTLILMDEIAAYATAAKAFREQVVVFFQELTETVKVVPSCALVVTLPSSVPYDEEGEKALQQLEKVFGRVEAIYTPVALEGDDIYEVLKSRLFEERPDADVARQVAQEYFDLYQRLGSDAPQEAREATYRDRMCKAYPFHPEVVDILLQRWSTFPTFQRTRGVLRLLADVVADLYGRKHDAPLIQPAHLNLSKDSIQREFIKHIGNEFAGVIASDIVGSGAKAPKIDREMGSEYARVGVASGLATSIFFGSFSGSEKRGVTVPWLRLAVLREGIPPALVGDALRRLESELWYAHASDGRYAFSNQPNLNRVIVEKEESVRDSDAEKELADRISRSAGTELRVYAFPKSPADVPDTSELKLAILSPEHARQASGTHSFVKELLSQSGSTFRANQNTLLLLVPDEGQIWAVHLQVRRLLAFRAIRDDRELAGRLSPENRKTLEGNLKNAEEGLPFRLMEAYRYVAKAGAAGAEWLDLGIPTSGERGSFAKRVRDYLEGQEYVLTKIAPHRLIEKAFGKDEEEKPLADVVGAFRKYPHLPMLRDDAAVKDAIVSGVKDGGLGVKVGERVYFGESVPRALLDDGVVVLRESAARRAKPLEVKEGGPAVAAPAGGTTQQGPGIFPPPPPPSPDGGRALRLRVKVPWQKLSDLLRGVIMPLNSDSAELDIEVTIDARGGPDGIKVSTLRTVGETLQQIGAEVLENSRE